MTLWQPDTCDCQITIADDGTFQAIGFVKQCIPHQNVNYGHADVLAENKRHNGVKSTLKATVPNNPYGLSFDASRTLNVKFTVPPNAVTVTNLQTQFNAAYGVGKVAVS